MAKVRRRAQIAYRCRVAVSVTFKPGRKAVHVGPARTRAQVPKHLRCRKKRLQHRVPLSSAFGGQITVICEDTDLGNINYYREKRAPESVRSHLKMLPIARSAARQLLRNLPIRQEL